MAKWGVCNSICPTSHCLERCINYYFVVVINLIIIIFLYCWSKWLSFLLTWIKWIRFAEAFMTNMVVASSPFCVPRQILRCNRKKPQIDSRLKSSEPSPVNSFWVYFIYNNGEIVKVDRFLMNCKQGPSQSVLLRRYHSLTFNFKYVQCK